MARSKLREWCCSPCFSPNGNEAIKDSAVKFLVERQSWLSRHQSGIVSLLVKAFFFWQLVRMLRDGFVCSLSVQTLPCPSIPETKHLLAGKDPQLNCWRTAARANCPARETVGKQWGVVGIQWSSPLFKYIVTEQGVDVYCHSRAPLTRGFFEFAKISLLFLTSFMHQSRADRMLMCVCVCVGGGGCNLSWIGILSVLLNILCMCMQTYYRKEDV